VDSRPTLIYLLRHGEVVGAEARRFIGHLDVPLSLRGERECLVQARRLRDADLAAVFSSDLRRSRRSAEIVAAGHGLASIAVPALREMAMGRWEGLSGDEIRRREPEAFEAWMAAIGEFPFPEGESVPDLAARAWPALESIATEFRGRTVAVVAHGGTNRALICRALGVSLGRLLSFGQDYGALSLLAHVDGRWRLVRLNETPVL